MTPDPLLPARIVQLAADAAARRRQPVTREIDTDSVSLGVDLKPRRDPEKKRLAWGQWLLAGLRDAAIVALLAALAYGSVEAYQTRAFLLDLYGVPSMTAARVQLRAERERLAAQAAAAKAKTPVKPEQSPTTTP